MYFGCKNSHRKPSAIGGQKNSHQPSARETESQSLIVNLVCSRETIHGLPLLGNIRYLQIIPACVTI